MGIKDPTVVLIKKRITKAERDVPCVWCEKIDDIPVPETEWTVTTRVEGQGDQDHIFCAQHVDEFRRLGWDTLHGAVYQPLMEDIARKRTPDEGL